MSGITLSAGIRANLLSLQNTASLMQTTQNDLATGKKVNSALDNPLEFFTSQNLNSRANSLSGLLDSMSNGIQTIQAANNGLTSITSLVQQLQSVAAQAQGDTSSNTFTAGGTSKLQVANQGFSNTSSSGGQIDFALAGGGSVGVSTFSATQVGWTLTGTPAGGFNGSNLAAGTGSINIQSSNINGGQAISVSLTNGETASGVAQSINQAITAADPTNGSHVWASVTGGNVVLQNDQGNAVTVTDGTTGGTGDTAAIFGAATGVSAIGTQLGAASIAAEINSNAGLAGVVKASVDTTSGALDLQNLTNTSIAVTGYKNATGAVTGVLTDGGDTLAAGTGSALSATRQSLLTQYNNLLTQVNQTANDSGYNGTNLLNGDALKLTFNENGTSSLTVQMVDSNNNPTSISASNLGLTAATTSEFASNSALTTLTTNITNALNSLQSQSSAISGSLSVVQNRQNFTTQMINTLQTGADNLVLADPNLEGANLLALQTRQSLSTTALSMASQAQQAVLRLFQ